MEKKTDLRIIKTYLALEKAFTDLLEKKPFEAITVNELCDIAMIRRTTFYKHFTDKYDYFNFYLSNMIQSSKEHVNLNIIKENPIEYTMLRMTEHLDFMRTHKKLVQNLINSNLIYFYCQTLQKQIEIELRDILVRIGDFKDSVETDFIIKLYAGGLISAIGWWIEHPDALSEKEFASLLVENLPFPFFLLNPQ